MASFHDSLRIFDAGNAKPYAAELFAECFGGAAFPEPRDGAGLSVPTPTENWRQYVAVYRWPDGREETVGFTNWIKFDEVYLGGGMCVRKNFYRRLSRDHFRECRAAGGVAQMILEASARSLTDCKALFGYCGDAKAMAVDLRAGFTPTAYSHVIVKWPRPLPEAEAKALIDAVARIGPF